METGHAAPIDPALVLKRLRAGAVSGGLFSVHAGIYLLVTFGLFVWQLIDNPSGLGVPAPRLIIPWGVLVLIHAAVVAVYSVLHDAFGSDYQFGAAPPTPSQHTLSPAQVPLDGALEQQPPRSVSRFRPAATSLADIRHGDQESQQASWRRPVQSIRQAAASFRHDDTKSGDGYDAWNPGNTRTSSEEERRAVGSQQLAHWRGGREPSGQGGDEAPGSSADGGERTMRPGQHSVVRPITPGAAEFDETEWRWLEAAATSHLARRKPDNGDGARQTEKDGSGASSSS